MNSAVLKSAVETHDTDIGKVLRELIRVIHNLEIGKYAFGSKRRLELMLDDDLRYLIAQLSRNTHDYSQGSGFARF